jgi:hypothetical protein
MTPPAIVFASFGVTVLKTYSPLRSFQVMKFIMLVLMIQRLQDKGLDEAYASMKIGLSSAGLPRQQYPFMMLKVEIASAQ